MDLLRGLTKQFYMAEFIIEMAREKNIVLKFVIEARYRKALEIPVSVFKRYRLGMKVSIDPRRSKRYLRKRYKGARIISINSNPTQDITYIGKPPLKILDDIDIIIKGMKISIDKMLDKDKD